MTIKEYLKKEGKNSVFTPLFIVKSKAKTASGINKAIFKETMDEEDKDFYQSQEDIDANVRGGWLSFHNDGFIVWKD